MPVQLDYAIPAHPGTVHDLLLQKSNGSFELAKGTNTVTVNFGHTHPALKIYDPTLGSAPTQTLTNQDSVTLQLIDHPVIIEL
jgi:hypothetical protein